MSIQEFAPPDQAADVHDVRQKTELPERVTAPAQAVLEHVAQAVDHIGHLLPAQGPIGVFVHHNTLHAFQHHSFHEAVVEAQRRLEVNGYLPEEVFRKHFKNGRITRRDIEAAMQRLGRASDLSEPGPAAPWGLANDRVDLLNLLHPMPDDPPTVRHWLIDEIGADQSFRVDVDKRVRDHIVERTTSWLGGLLDRIGRDMTMSDFATSVLGESMLVSAEAAESDRSAMDWLTLFGLSEELRDGYLLLASQRSGARDPKEPRLATWLASEHACVSAAFDRWTGLACNVNAWRRAVTARPAALALSLLHAICRTPCRAAGVVHSDVLPDRVGRDRTPRDLIANLTGNDATDLVHPFLIRWCGAFLDDGIAHWTMPGRELGFWHAWRSTIQNQGGLLPSWLRELRSTLAAFPADASPTSVLVHWLNELGVAHADHDQFLERIALQLPGWAGMFYRLQEHPEDRADSAPPARLVDFLAVRLTLDVLAWRVLARKQLHYSGPLRSLASALKTTWLDQQARPVTSSPDTWRLFQLFQTAGIAPNEARTIPVHVRHRLLDRLDSFDELARRQIWQEAYEAHYRDQILSAVAVRRSRLRGRPEVQNPRYQLMACMDDREEAFRRALEELEPRTETFGVAGFFGIAMNFQRFDQTASAPLCPVVVTPAHDVVEEPDEGHHHLAERRLRRLSLLARIRRGVRRGSRSLVAGSVLIPLLGIFSVVPMVGRILFPRIHGRLQTAAEKRLVSEPKTRLTLLQTSHDHVPSAWVRARGFSLREQADRVAAQMENMGFVHQFAPIICVMGHGSRSVNNPHLSAYDCGACGGRHGGPNARAFAGMANRAEVRALLAERGIVIPPTTWFVGAEHNTATDEVEYYDLEYMPPALQSEWQEFLSLMLNARKLSAHERCRKFESASHGMSPTAALRHVEGRAEDISQARPELGHVTNAVAFVGRRSLTRHLFLDRRSFLISYDPTIDPQLKILERILVAVGPVGAGINLEYYFSTVDNDKLGAGTKLPHNLTGLLGVMDGHASDLRTGLPRQMIEIHEPMRLLLVIENTPEAALEIVNRQPGVAELVAGQWVQVATIHPETGEIRVFHPSTGFQPFNPVTTTLPEVERSQDWYSGKRDFLSPALVLPPLRSGSTETQSGREVSS
jgi:uncharacterized protein YbcC (UPF0753/DUF2309 family)